MLLKLLENLEDLRKLLVKLNFEFEMEDSWISNGCEHGHKPAKDCPNPDCADAMLHKEYDRLVNLKHEFKQEIKPWPN